jgi:hypothetical protein
VGLGFWFGYALRRIAISEIWILLASLCAMAAVDDAGFALASLKLGVDVPGSSQCFNHTLRSNLYPFPGKPCPRQWPRGRLGFPLCHLAFSGPRDPHHPEVARGCRSPHFTRQGSAPDRGGSLQLPLQQVLLAAFHQLEQPFSAELTSDPTTAQLSPPLRYGGFAI